MEKEKAAQILQGMLDDLESNRFGITIGNEEEVNALITAIDCLKEVSFRTTCAYCGEKFTEAQAHAIHVIRKHPDKAREK